MRSLLLSISFLLFMSVVQAQVKTDVQIGLSRETVEISSSFDGTDIVVFGSIENADKQALVDGKYDIVVVLVGPKEEVIVRRKENKFGIWVNGSSLRFGDVPSSYSVATTRPLAEISDSNDVKILQIGLENLNVVPDEDFDAIGEEKVFKESLNRLKLSQNLYSESIGGVKFLSPSLFKATLSVPANVPIGRHTAQAFLFKEGKFVNAQFAEMQVKKIGFEQFTYDLAHRNGLLFGIIAVIIAIATGWLASVIFRKD